MLTSIHYCTCTSQLEFPLFHVSTNVLYVMTHVDDKYLNGSLHSPDTAALKTALYSVVYVFRKPTFRYLLFMRLF